MVAGAVPRSPLYEAGRGGAFDHHGRVPRRCHTRYDDEVDGEGWFHDRYQGEDSGAADNRAVRGALQPGRPLVYFY